MGWVLHPLHQIPGEGRHILVESHDERVEFGVQFLRTLRKFVRGKLPGKLLGHLVVKKKVRSSGAQQAERCGAKRRFVGRKLLLCGRYRLLSESVQLTIRKG